MRISTLIIASLFFIFAADASAQVFRPVKNVNPRFRNNIQIKKIDPAVVSLRKQSTSRGNRTYHQVYGVVKNIGNTNYRSAPNQQQVLLYKNRRLVKTVPFSCLGPGQTVALNYNYNQPRYGSQPSKKDTWQIVISYDPDIFNDSNHLNDDCQLGNNRMVRRLR